jgi:WD40 repeat protein
MTVENEQEQWRVLERMSTAAQHAAARLGGQGTRRATGISLVALLCAGALAPIAAAGMALGPIALAAVGVAGSVGAGKMTELCDDAINALRRDGKEPDESAIEKQLAERLEEALGGASASSAALRETAAELLRGLGVVQGAVAEDLARLGDRFTEFEFVIGDVRAGVIAIERMIAEQTAARDREAEQLFHLTKAVESSRMSASGPDGSAGQSPRWGKCPYLGLLAYGPGDARFFFGRKRLTFELQQRLLLDHRSAQGPLVVTGPSGAGKSSLLRAGLLPALARGEVLPATANWPCHVITPTSSPLRRLSAALADVCELAPEAIFNQVSLDPGHAAVLVAEGLARRGDGCRLVLIVDQFEEVFTRAGDDGPSRAELKAFLAALSSLAHGAAPGPNGTQAPAVVVAAVRGDFLDQALELPWLDGARGAGLFRVGAMTAAELSGAITGPAAEAGLTVEPELVRELLADAREHPGALALGSGVLPLVSQLMTRVWEHREGGKLTMRGYRRAGSLADAVNQDATLAYEQLDHLAQHVARAVFLRLTLVSPEGLTVRRPAARTDLYQAAQDQREAVDRLLESFAARRLLVLENDRVEIAHEALPQGWRLLQTWLDEDRADLAVYGRLSTDADTWEQHGEKPAYLYPAGRLDEITRLKSHWDADPQRYPVPSTTVNRFVDAGRAAERSRRSLRRRVLIGLLVLALAATGAAVDAAVAANHSQQEAAAARLASEAAISRELAAESQNLDSADLYTARQLAAAAWRESPTNEAVQAAATLLKEQAGMLVVSRSAVMSTAYNPSGTELAVGTYDGTLRLWNPVTRRQIGATMPDTRSTGGVESIAFNPAGTVLAAASTDGVTGTVKLWNPATQKQIGTTISTRLSTLFGGEVAFNSTGTTLATAGEDGTVGLWDPATQQQIGTLGVAGSAQVDSVVFDPSGTLLAAAYYDGTVRLWNPATQKQIGTTIKATSATLGVESLAFNPAGTTLATGDSAGTVRLWNAATQQQVGVTITAAPASEYGVRRLSFNPAGTLLATAGGSTARLWDATTHQQVGSTLNGGTDGSAVDSLAFNRDGTVLAAGNGQGTVTLWNPATQTAPSTATIGASSALGEVGDLAFSPRGDILAAAERGGTVKLFDPATLKQIGSTIQASPALSADGGIAFNPAGTILATADGDGTVKLWNPATQRQIGAPITADDAPTGVMNLAFNASGTLLASVQYSGTVKLWNPATGQQVGSTIVNGEFGTAHAVAFSPSGDLLALGTSTGTVQLWNPATQQKVGATMTVTSSSTAMVSVAFNSKGTVLATAADDGTVKFWNPATQQQIGNTIVATNALPGVSSIAFNSEGTMLASAEADGTVKLWSPSTQQEIGGPISVGTSQDAVNSVAFNAEGTVLAVAVNNGPTKLVNLSQETSVGAELCDEYGMPPASTWAQDVGSTVPEPSGCS